MAKRRVSGSGQPNTQLDSPCQASNPQGAERLLENKQGYLAELVKNPRTVSWDNLDREQMPTGDPHLTRFSSKLTRFHYINGLLARQARFIR
jgi:hypothetical protein